MNKSALVLGTSRSGTSMTAGILHYLGVNMNPSQKRSELTPRGTFEDVNWSHLTKQIRDDIRGRKIPPRDIRGKYRERIQELIRSGLWGFKSAATIHCLSVIYREIENPHLIFVWRNPEDTAKSKIYHAKKREGRIRNYSDTYNEVIDHRIIMDRLYQFYPCPKINISYEQIRRDPIEVSESLARFLGISITPEMKDSIRDLIIPDHQTWQKEERND